MTPFFASPHSTIYHGDALAVLRELPNASVDAILADPPYCSGGATPAERTLHSTRQKYVASDARHALPDFCGDQRDQRSFTYWCTLWLAECLRLTKPGGVCMVFIDWRQLPCLTDALQAAGWVWRGQVVWHKPNARPQRGRFTNAAEYVVWGSRGPMGDGASQPCMPGFYAANPPRGGKRIHITQKPLALLRDLIQITAAGATVLDPFIGSGTTGVAAVLEGRRFVGIELSEHFARQAAKRIEEAEDIRLRAGGVQ